MPHPWPRLLLSSAFVCGFAAGLGATSQDDGDAGKFYRIENGAVDAGTYNGFRRYHASCNHCHGPDGIGSTFAGSLIDHLPDVETFRRIVLEGLKTGDSVMRGFAGDPNVEPNIDDIYAYLQARADGALGRGRPKKLGQ